MSCSHVLLGNIGFMWMSLGHGPPTQTRLQIKYTLSWQLHSLMAVVLPTGKCTLPQRKNCTGLRNVSKCPRCRPCLHFSCIPVPSVGVAGTNRIPRGPNVDQIWLRQDRAWTSGGVLWCQAPGAWWQILRVLFGTCPHELVNGGKSQQCSIGLSFGQFGQPSLKDIMLLVNVSANHWYVDGWNFYQTWLIMLMAIWGWWWNVEGMVVQDNKAAYSHSKIKPFSGKVGPSPSVMVTTKQVFKGQTIIFLIPSFNHCHYWLSLVCSLHMNDAQRNFALQWDDQCSSAMSSFNNPVYPGEITCVQMSDDKNPTT